MPAMNTPPMKSIWKATDYPEELSSREFADWAQQVAAAGGTHVVVGGLPLARWQMRDARDPHPEWTSWPVWSMINPSVFKLVVPRELAEWLPAEDAALNMRLVKERCAILRQLGLKGAFFGNDPMWLPEDVYRAHPEWRGAQGELTRIAHLPYFSPCIDRPEVLDMYRRAMAEIARQAPEIDVYSFFTNDSCGGVCWTRPYPGDNGPEECRRRPVTERLAGFLAALRAGAKDAGVEIEVNLDNIQHVPVNYAALEPGLAVNSRTSGRRPWKADVTASGHFVVDQIFPVVGIPRPILFLSQLEAAYALEARHLDIGRWRQSDPLPLAVFRRFAQHPTNGPASRMALLRDVAAEAVGERQAESLLSIWAAIEDACVHLQHVHVKGTFNILLVGPAMMRWLLMPLVPDIARLTDEEKADYMGHRVAVTAQEADSYHCLLGEQGIVGNAGVWMARHALSDAVEDVSAAMARADGMAGALADAAQRDPVNLLGRRLRAWRCVILTTRNFVDYQHTLTVADRRHTSLIWRRERFGNNDINEASLELRQIARAEADNALALAHLLEASPGPLLVMARTPAEEDSFHFHPGLARQLRRKSAVMMDHWRDYLELYPPQPPTEPNGAVDISGRDP